VLVAYLYYCGIVEEQNLAATFPKAYPGVQKQDEDAHPLPPGGQRMGGMR
jgi:hypothetical protein